MEITPLSTDAFDSIWHIVEPIVRAGETYAYPPDATKEMMRDIWFYGGKARVFVALEGGEAVGTYYIKPNQMEPAAHTANAGFMTSRTHQGKGIASAMADHMLHQAKKLGYHAIQFNMVLEDNIPSLKIWEKRGFNVLGRIPDAYRKPDGSYVSAFILHKVIG
jgi:RimJ/RimL family protein N-acetyltransferase